MKYYNFGARRQTRTQRRARFRRLHPNLAMFKSIVNRNTESIDRLLHEGVDINVTNDDGDTPLTDILYNNKYRYVDNPNLFETNFINILTFWN